VRARSQAAALWSTHERRHSPAQGISLLFRAGGGSMRISALLGARRCSVHIVSSWPTPAPPGLFLRPGELNTGPAAHRLLQDENEQL
jgi:hypothetical protein